MDTPRKAPRPELDMALRAVRAAWQAIQPLYQVDIAVRHKPDGPVTEADHLANRVLLDHIAREFPQDAVLSEETAPDPARLGNPRVWIVDPIDGTRDFIDGSGHFAVQMGLAEERDGAYRPTLGVVMHPVAGEVFYADKGAGAWVRSGEDAPRPLSVSRTEELSEMTAVFTRSHRTGRFLQLIDRMAPRARIGMGSIGLKVVWVASGRADYYLNNARGMCNEWDVCAPEAILTESGGVLSDLNGDPIAYNRSDPNVPHGILASGGTAHEALRLRILETERRVRRQSAD